MATATSKARCIICEKEKRAVRCEGCSQIFCFNHLNDHRQQLSQQFDEIEINRDLFRQIFNEQINNQQEHFLIKQIDKWEFDSIEIIQKTAKQCKDEILQFTTQHFQQVETNLKELTTELREIRQENDFNEIDLKNFKEKLINLEKQLEEIQNISIEQYSTSFINQIYVLVSSTEHPSIPNIHANIRSWIQEGITVSGGNGHGRELNKLWDPYGLDVDDDENIYIADRGNDRIVKWKKSATIGQIIAGATRDPGSRNNQLHNPTDIVVDKETNSVIICDYTNKRVVRWPCENGTSGITLISSINCYGVAMDNNGYLYVSDHIKHEVRRWKIGDTNGILVAGGNGKGKRLDQLNDPTYICVDQDHSVYISDSGNHRVIKWMTDATEGIVVAGGQGKGDSLKQLSKPGGLVVDQLGTIYVADYNNERVMSWPKGNTQGSIVVGGHGWGKKPNEFRGPWALSFDRHGSLYVVDYFNHRVPKFPVDLSANS